jgi:uncharacterized protein
MKSACIHVITFLFFAFALLSCTKERTIIKDEAAVITAAQRDSLESVIRQFEERTGTQIGVYIFHSLEGQTLADVSKTAFAKSGLAENPSNKGILISMAMMDRAMKIEVGTSFKDILPDDRCDEIMIKIMLPHYLQGKHFKGLSAGVNELMSIVENDKAASKPVLK